MYVFLMYVGRNLLHTLQKKTYVRNLSYIKKSAIFAMPESNCGVVLFLSVIHT